MCFGYASKRKSNIPSTKISFTINKETDDNDNEIIFSQRQWKSALCEQSESLIESVSINKTAGEVLFYQRYDNWVNLFTVFSQRKVYLTKIGSFANDSVRKTQIINTVFTARTLTSVLVRPRFKAIFSSTVQYPLELALKNRETRLYSFDRAGADHLPTYSLRHFSKFG